MIPIQLIIPPHDPHLLPFLACQLRCISYVPHRLIIIRRSSSMVSLDLLLAQPVIMGRVCYLPEWDPNSLLNPTTNLSSRCTDQTKMNGDPLSIYLLFIL